MNDASHPMWSLIRLTVLMIGLNSVLLIVSEKYNAQEITVTIAAFLTAVTAEIGVYRLTRVNK